MVWKNLDKSDYDNFSSLCRNFALSVTTLHSKLVARANLDNGEIAFGSNELESTVRTILKQAFVTHGVNLRQDLKTITTTKTSTKRS